MVFKDQKTGLFHIGRLITSQEEVDTINPTWDVEDKVFAKEDYRSFATKDEAENAENAKKTTQ